MLKNVWHISSALAFNWSRKYMVAPTGHKNCIPKGGREAFQCILCSRCMYRSTEWIELYLFTLCVPVNVVQWAGDVTIETSLHPRLGHRGERLHGHPLRNPLTRFLTRVHTRKHCVNIIELPDTKRNFITILKIQLLWKYQAVANHYCFASFIIYHLQLHLTNWPVWFHLKFSAVHHARARLEY